MELQIVVLTLTRVVTIGIIIGDMQVACRIFYTTLEI
jgi:hypothetical protein